MLIKNLTLENPLHKFKPTERPQAKGKPRSPDFEDFFFMSFEQMRQVTLQKKHHLEEEFPRGKLCCISEMQTVRNVCIQSQMATACLPPTLEYSGFGWISWKTNWSGPNRAKEQEINYLLNKQCR